MSPDNLLHLQGVKYDGSGDSFGNDPATIVAALIEINKTRTWNPDVQMFMDVYYDPPFSVVAFNPNSFDPKWDAKEQAATDLYLQAFHAGNLKLAHYAVDQINAIRGVKGGVAYTGKSDFEILLNAQTPIGIIARKIETWRQADMNGRPAPIEWYDTKAAFDAINSWAV